MKKPSDQFRIDETNSLLGQVPGMATFAGKQRVTGGNGGKVDTQMQVEDTNKLVESIVGGVLGQLQESGPASTSHQKLYEAHAEADSLWDVASGISVAHDEIFRALKNAKDPGVKADIERLHKENQKVLALANSIAKKWEDQ